MALVLHGSKWFRFSLRGSVTISPYLSPRTPEPDLENGCGGSSVLGQVLRGVGEEGRSSEVTVDGAEAWQGDPAFFLQVLLKALVDPLDQGLLKQQGVVGAQRAGGVVVGLVVVAQVRLTQRGDVLVHVHLLAQRHHQQDACNDGREREMERERERDGERDGEREMVLSYLFTW